MLTSRKLTVVSLVVLATARTGNAQAVDSAFARQVDSIATLVLRGTGVPSASVAIVRHGKLEYAQAYGVANLETGARASTDMRYALGSISKQFTASAILLLQQEGKLSIDDRIGRFLPGLTRANEVTIRQVLSHTSGYQDFWPQDYLMPGMRNDIMPQAILDQWAKKPLDFDPGARWQYSNTNYTVAGLIVEKASGKPFFQFIRERILQPLALTGTADFDASPRAVNATGYIRYALGPLHSAPDAGSGWMWAAGELAMTATNLAKWDISLIKQSLLSKRSYHTLETDVHLNNGASTGYGLGVDVAMSGGHFLVSHGGEVSGFTAENMVFPEDSAAIVVLTNQDAAPAAGAIAQQISQILFVIEDALSRSRTARARQIFEGLQRGVIDRALFTSNANAYFSDIAIRDFASSLGPLGTPTSFTQTREANRGGMVLRSYRVVFPGRTVRAWTFEMPDGTLEQFQVAPQG